MSNEHRFNICATAASALLSIILIGAGHGVGPVVTLLLGSPWSTVRYEGGPLRYVIVAYLLSIVLCVLSWLLQHGGRAAALASGVCASGCIAAAMMASDASAARLTAVTSLPSAAGIALMALLLFRRRV